MSVISHRHVQFLRRHNSKTSVYSGGSAAKDIYYLPKVRKVSPETGGFAAVALSHYYDDELEWDREDFQNYQEPVRNGIDKGGQHSRSQEYPLYEPSIQQKEGIRTFTIPRQTVSGRNFHQITMLHFP